MPRFPMNVAPPVFVLTRYKLVKETPYRLPSFGSKPRSVRIVPSYPI
jgi:hypothetical protein